MGNVIRGRHRHRQVFRFGVVVCIRRLYEGLREGRIVEVQR